MRFVLVKLASLLAQPDVLLVVLGLVGLARAWPRRGRRRRGGFALLSLSLGGFAAILLLPVGQWLLLPLENRFPRPDPPPAQVDGIILLGGAEEVELSEARGLPSFNDTMETVTEFVALARRYPTATLAFSGGTGAMTGNRMSEAEIVQELFPRLGLDRPVITESSSRDTYENAVLLRQVVHPEPGGVWLLVTAASHMPRSVGVFRAVGWPVLAWPAAYKSAGLRSAQWRRPDLAAHLGAVETALHEWEGLVAYYAIGRTRTLFPAPETK